ncbi:MAG: methylated-DNA--[protein]-cysteine S-methyltransferase [Bacteroidales bacterium]|nr:methylated-DNA--[protein]-cysteine S-methyltransferase [Bacteroidales bacterium]
METIIVTHFASPCGELVLGVTDGRLCLCDWNNEERRISTEARLLRSLHARCEAGSSETLRKAQAELEEYFAKTRRVFTIPLTFPGTAFQCRVWEALTKIPYGETVSYGEMARLIGQPSAVRAVANAVAANPMSIIVPCHRVVGSDNSLTGYAGGLEAKQFLLNLEREKSMRFS